MHRLLERQLKQHIGSVDSIPDEWQSFVNAVDETYHQADADRALLERSLDLTSQELLERNQQLKQQIIAEQERTRLVEDQGAALLDVVQSVALGDLDVAIEVPEGTEVLSELAVGIEMMVDDLRETMAAQEQARAELEEARRQIESALEETRQANFLMGVRVKELDCLNDIGRKIDQDPPLPTFLEWVAGRIPLAMQHTEVCLAAIEYDGQLYGAAEAVQLPRQMVGGLRVGGERVGQVTIAYTEEHDFLDAESALLGDIVRRVSGYIENRRLIEQTQEQLTDLTTIQEATSELTAALTFDQAIKALLPRVASAVQADTVSMFLINGEQMTRVGMYPTGEGQDTLIGQTLSLADYPLTQQVVETRRPLALRADDPRLQAHARRAFKAAGVTANATIPLVGRKGVLGTLAISLHQPGRALTAHDVNLLQTLADQATTVIQNLRLIKEAQARARREGQLREITNRLRTPPDVDGVMRVLVQELGQALGRRAVVHLGQHTANGPTSAQFLTPAPNSKGGE